MSSIIKFLDQEYPAEKQSSQDIQVLADTYRRRVKGIEIFFPPEGYDRTWNIFEEIQDMTSTVTHGSASVESLFIAFRRGRITIDINIASRQYKEEYIIVLIQKITRLIKKHPLPART